jgi:hypothetical protein
LHPQLGRLAQLVQSTSFTPRGSGVRTPHRPQKNPLEIMDFFVLGITDILRIRDQGSMDQSQNLWISFLPYNL